MFFLSVAPPPLALNQQQESSMEDQGLFPILFLSLLFVHVYSISLSIDGML